MSDVSAELHPVTASVFSRFYETGKRFLHCYVLGLFTLALSYPISAFSGNKPDIATVSGFANVLASLFAILAVVILLGKFVHMALVEKPDNPTKALFTWTKSQITQEYRLINTVHMLFSVSLFMVGFAVLKGAIAVLEPFSWDRTFVDWDRAVHFGFLPHEWLMPLINNAAAVSFFNLFYNLWFFVLLTSLIVAGASASRSVLHLRFLVGFMVTWLVPGFFIAMLFSSAGPCFYEKATLGTTYVPLMDALTKAAESHSIWALSTQDLLWEGYVGARDGSAGISAFPSLHVATSVLIALYAGTTHRILGIIAWGFAAIIMLGSVVLAWHYAVDGYAGAAMAWLIWKMVPRLHGFHRLM